jgi:putative flippase GtrA
MKSMLRIKKKRSNLLFQRIFIFAKAQASAFIGGVTDYCVMIFFTEVVGIHYTLSIVIGGIIGAVVNFKINKNWTFFSKANSYSHSERIQFTKFVIVVINSIFLKSSGTYLITTYLYDSYKINRIIVDLIVSLGCNYPLQKYWVFKKELSRNLG